MEPTQGERSVLRLTLGLGGFVVILAGMQYMSELVNQVLLAVFLTLVMAPISAKLMQRGMRGKWANLLVLLIVLVVAALIGTFLIFSLSSFVKGLPAYESSLDETQEQLTSQLAVMGLEGESVVDAITRVSKQVLGLTAVIAAGTVGTFIDLFFVFLMFAFLLYDVAGIRARMALAFSSDNPSLSRISNSTKSVAVYLRLLTYINLTIGVLNTIFLYIIGIPNPALWGFLAFVTGYIPFIGFWIAMIPVLILGYLQGGVMLMLVILIAYWLINGSLSNIVAPKVYGTGLNLAPVVTLVAVLFWGAILGPIGGMLAVPLTAILSSVVLISYPETRWLALLMRQGDGSD